MWISTTLASCSGMVALDEEKSIHFVRQEKGGKSGSAHDFGAVYEAEAHTSLANQFCMSGPHGPLYVQFYCLDAVWTGTGW